ncbi:MAG: lysophospholipid acyltransferase family protein [Acidobacteriota bacterium]|jgi:1-acyl-sn-glycerol-3-phosphate acyltransferase
MKQSSENLASPHSPLRRAVGRLHYLLTILVGAVLMLIIGIPIIFSSMLVRKLFGIDDFVYPVAKRAVKIFVYATGARIKVNGLENADPRQTYLFVANHQSNLDPAILFAWLRHNVGGIAKKELEKIPFFKQGFSVAHIVPIDRQNRERAIESTRRGAAKLGEGHSLMAFPEGTRSADGRLKDFKKGVFFMALEAGVPIVPIAINDTRLVMPKLGALVIPGRISIDVLPPISTAGYDDDNIQELIARVKGEIEKKVQV